MSEPAREKILRENSATLLTVTLSSLQAVVNQPTPAMAVCQSLLETGRSQCKDLQVQDREYSIKLDVPADDAGIAAYTSKITKFHELILDWGKLQTKAMQALHSDTQTAPSPPCPPSVNTKKPDRPTIDLGSSDTEWAFFMEEWRLYKAQAHIAKQQDIINELRATCSLDLRRSLFEYKGQLDYTISEVDLLSRIKKCAVQSKNVAVHRAEFHKCFQGATETFHEFVMKLKAKAEQCQFHVVCTDCSQNVSFLEDMVSDRMVSGCYDDDIQGEILSKAATLTTFDARFDAMHALELGKRAKCDLQETTDSSSSTAGAHRSAYQSSKRESGTGQRNDNPPNPSRGFSEKCFGCGEKLHGRNMTEHLRKRHQTCSARNTTCSNCHLRGHLTSLCRKPKAEQPPGSNRSNGTSRMAIVTEPSTETGGSRLFAISSSEASTVDASRDDNHDGRIAHMEWSDTDNAFRPCPPDPPPYCDVTVQVLDDCHQLFGRHHPRSRRFTDSQLPVPVLAVADTGAQTCTAGPEFLETLRVPRGYLLHTKHKSVGIGNDSLSILGCVMVLITHGAQQTRQLVYIAKGVHGFYLSDRALASLQLLPAGFPHTPADIPTTSGASMSHSSKCAPCGCPLRSTPPGRPREMPLMDREGLERWMLEHYASSAFNVCEHQLLPKMTGAPLDIHFKDDYTPKAVHTPIAVAHHWKSIVKQALDRDVRLGTIEPVPQGTPVNWCSRMIVVPKHDHTPRRVVDLQSLNEATKRETHPTASPYSQVSVVPPNMTKTTLDAWNGYHSLALAPSARDATTFITEWGRYRYLRAPQGFHAAGDAYTRRFDDITIDVERKAKVIDDTLLWDHNITSAFWHTIDYLELCSRNGIIFNPSKFKFAQDELDFAGFTVTTTGIRPSESLTESILNFPTPSCITDVRSWFGLVQQIAYATAISPLMQPFRDLLDQKAEWYWDDTLHDIFRSCKQLLVEAVADGVMAFEMNRTSCLATDWSKTGLGYYLLQKHCACSMEKAPNCCTSGWKLVTAGSRFTSDAESRYAPVEGEALAIAEALDRCRVFVLGCDNLIVATDHKPLLKILGDKELENIRNPRLLRIKEKTLMYRFAMQHVPGGWHTGPDALSRYPVRPSDSGISCSLDTSVQSSVISALHSNEHAIRPITWTRLRDAARCDPTSCDLVETIANGFPPRSDQLPKHLQPYWSIRDILSSIDGVPLAGERAVVPASLRGEVLDNLHAAHQGVSSMTARARTTVFWPTIKNAIQQRRDRCKICNRIAPSHPAEPLLPPASPEYPFQQVCADFFKLNGYDYLVYVDRYTSW